jgi:hypothetical protein
MEILRTLGEADRRLSFSELRDGVGIEDSGQFNYHLGKLTGHFVGKTEAGYGLRQAGHRVIEAVLSGAITDDPVLEPTPIDEPCLLCGGTTVVAYIREHLAHYCTECEGSYGVPDEVPGDGSSEGYGYLGGFPLPSAGIRGRSPAEMFRAATTWGGLELLAVANRVCPRCSAPLEDSREVCEAHDATGGHCEACGNRRPAQVEFQCTNCVYGLGGALVLALTAQSDLLSFLVEHGINPVSPTQQASYYAAVMDYEEEVHSVDPFEASLTFSLDGDELTLTVDDDLAVVGTKR